MKNEVNFPEYQDRVKHKKNETVGTVIAKYDKEGITYFDVRGLDERIYYATLAENWETLSKEENNW